MKLDEPAEAALDVVRALRGDRLGNVRFDRLWAAGSLTGLGAPCIAVVGSRAPSDAGRARAREFARDLAAAGVCVLSGLAHGIDAAAHEGALEAGGLTVGVLGGGHRHFFPRRNLALAERMMRGGGAVVSPYPPDEPARPAQFIQRNGVIAALADGVVVIEAAARSGSLNTAGWANDRGISVFAVPGDVDRAKAAGCNALIRDGATLARSAGDVLADLKILAPGDTTTGGRRGHAREARRVREAATERTPFPEVLDAGMSAGADAQLARRLAFALASEAAVCDTLVEVLARDGGPPPELDRVLATLTLLELHGTLCRSSDGRYNLASNDGSR